MIVENYKVLYHAGPVLISDFIIPFGGLHFGSKDSAVQAASRKGSEYFIHECLVPLGITVPVDDLGCAERWEEEIQYSKVEGDSLEYTNRYEPGRSKSYVLMKQEVLDKITVLNVTHHKRKVL